MHEKVKIKYLEVKKEIPDIDHKMVEIFIEDMPEESIIFFDKILYGCHIASKEFYDKAVDLLEWAGDKGDGEKFTVEECTRLSNIDFNTKDYTKYDFAYVVNMMFSDYCTVFIETSYYLKMAKNYLEDSDYMGDPSERAYHNAKKRIRYFKENEE